MTLAHKIVKQQEKQLNKRSLISDKISQANQHAKALQKLSKLKTSLDSRLYSNISNRFGQLLLFPQRMSVSFLLSLTLFKLHQASSKIQKLCHNPTKPPNAHNLVKQLMTSRCNRNTVHALTMYPTHPNLAQQSQIN